MKKKSLAAALCLSLLLSSTCIADSRVYTDLEFNDALSNPSTLSVFLKRDDNNYSRYLYADGLGNSLDSIFAEAPTGSVVHYYTSNPATYQQMLSYVEDHQENGNLLNGYFLVGGSSGNYVDNYGNTIYDLWISRLPLNRYNRFRSNYYNGAIGIAINILWPEDRYWYRYSHVHRNYWRPVRYSDNRWSHNPAPYRDDRNWNHNPGNNHSWNRPGDGRPMVNRPGDNRNWNRPGENRPGENRPGDNRNWNRPGNNRPGENRSGDNHNVNRPGDNRPGDNHNWNRPGDNRPGNNRPGENRSETQRNNTGAWQHHNPNTSQGQTVMQRPQQQRPQGQTVMQQPQQQRPQVQTVMQRPQQQGPQGQTVMQRPQQQRPQGQTVMQRPQQQGPQGQFSAPSNHNNNQSRGSQQHSSNNNAPGPWNRR